jgi:thiosulfate/3-mercaptopyruvate sulfurtransferase
MKNLLSPQGLEGYLVLDARFRLNDPRAAEKLFAEGHIPGAQYVDLNRDLSGPKGKRLGRHPLPSRDALRELFSRLGIGADTKVLAYDDTDHAGAARLWMLLKWMGHAKVWVLDGGFQRWKDQGRPVEKGAGSGRPPAVFHEAEPLVELVDRDHLGGRIIDMRAPERFRGEVEPIDSKAGHIPGAGNLFYQMLLKDGCFIAAERLRGRLPKERTVYYCGSGVTAAVALLAADEAGLPGAVYPGSWSEWITDPSAPVETGEFRRGVVGVPVNEKGEILMFERADHVNSWQFPQGGIEGEETEEEALYRELFEEIGVRGARVLRRGDFTTTYDWIKGEKKGRRGQRHWWFLVELSSEPNLARGDGSFSSYEWVKPELAVERVIDWKQAAMREGLRALRLI